jgi:hypothetical protein
MRSRIGHTVVTAALAAALGLAATPAAHADPSGPPVYRQLAGVGADNSAGLMDALSNAITVGGVKVMGSYDGTGSESIQTQSPSACIGYRPDGSVSGRNALITSQFYHDGCIQFTTSSWMDLSGIHNQSLTYIPFAQDAVTYAVTSSSQIPRNLDWFTLMAMYQCDPSVVGSGPNWAYRPLLPEPGSGLRAFWEGKMGILDSDVAAGKYGCLNDEIGGQPIKEEDGRVLTDTSIIPFSIASYNAEMGQKVQDLRGNAVLGSIDGTAPNVPNPAFPAALNGLTYAVNSTTNVPRALGTADLRQIYQCNPTYVGTGPNYALHPLLPAEGSSIRSAWETAMGVTDAQVTSGKLPCISDTAAGAAVGDNDGRVLIDPNALVPYSISAYGKELTQQIEDLHGESVLGSVDGILPQAFNPAAKVTREIYNVVPTSLWSTAPYNAVFFGSGSLICGQTSLITGYGFAPAPDCGSTTNVTAPIG